MAIVVDAARLAAQVSAVRAFMILEREALAGAVEPDSGIYRRAVSAVDELEALATALLKDQQA